MALLDFCQLGKVNKYKPLVWVAAIVDWRKHAYAVRRSFTFFCSSGMLDRLWASSSDMVGVSAKVCALVSGGSPPGLDIDETIP
jgi:hypothetical protein